MLKKDKTHLLVAGLAALASAPVLVGVARTPLLRDQGGSIRFRFPVDDPRWGSQSTSTLACGTDGVAVYDSDGNYCAFGVPGTPSQDCVDSASAHHALNDYQASFPSCPKDANEMSSKLPRQTVPEAQNPFP